MVKSYDTPPIWKKPISRRVDFIVSLVLATLSILLIVIVNVANGIIVPPFWVFALALLIFTICYAIFAGVRLISSIQWNRPLQLPKQIRSLSIKQKVALVSALAILVVFMVCINSNQSGNAPTSVAKPAPIPAPTRHDISVDEIMSNSAYWNTSWRYRHGDLVNVTRRVNQQYLQTHTYIANETDCNDMAIDIWNMLRTEGIVSIIVLGNVDNPAPLTALNQCNHVFLLIFNLGDGESKPMAFFLEPTNGELYFGDDLERNPQLKLYFNRGFYYVKPSDLRADLGKNW